MARERNDLEQQLERLREHFLSKHLLPPVQYPRVKSSMSRTNETLKMSGGVRKDLLTGDDAKAEFSEGWLQSVALDDTYVNIKKRKTRSQTPQQSQSPSALHLQRLHTVSLSRRLSHPHGHTIQVIRS